MSIYYCGESATRKEQRQMLLELLHGSQSEDYIGLPHKDTNGKDWYNIVLPLSKLNLEQHINEGLDTYISVNRFSIKKRDSDYCTEITGIFLDIDILHDVNDYPIKDAEEIRKIVYKKIVDLCLSGMIPFPTAIIYTGRGLSLFYRYDTPIKTENPESVKQHMIAYPQIIRALQQHFTNGKIFQLTPIAKKYKKNAIVDVDTVVTDMARVMRLPGTYNSKAGRYAELVFVNSDYTYAPAELYSAFGVDHTKADAKAAKKNVGSNKPSEKKSNAPVNPDIPPKTPKKVRDLAKQRIGWLTRLAEMRDYHEGRGREVLIFVVYCHLKQIYSINESQKKLREINNLLSEPLDDKELGLAMNGVDSHIERAGLHANGFYAFRTETLIDRLALTNEEVEMLGLNSNRQAEEQRRINRENDLKRDWLICKLYLSGLSAPKVAQNLPKEFVCSAKTVKRTVKRLGISKERNVLLEDLDFEGNRLYCRHRNEKKGTTLTKLEEKKEGYTGNEHNASFVESYVEQMRCGENWFVTGEGGSGKTYLIKRFVEEARIPGKKVLITAPTNLTANAIGGQTLHKAFGLEPKRYDGTEALNRYFVCKLSQYDTVIIDEISMVHMGVFTIVMRMIAEAETLKRTTIQVIVVGDFSQLPPIDTEDKKYWSTKQQIPFAFRSEYWANAGFDQNIIVLAQNFRQAVDLQYADVCRAIRFGDTSKLDYLNTRVNTSYKYSEEAIHLCPTNALVDEINRKCIERHKLDPTYQLFIANGSMDNVVADIPQSIHVYVGMPVILTENTKDYCKGQIGTITKVNRKSVRVDIKGISVLVRPYDYRCNDGSVVSQLPLAPAYAITIHKAQGMTLDRAIVHPQCFAPHQLYVALTRVQSSEDLILAGKIRDKYVIIDPDALRYSQAAIDNNVIMFS